MQPPSRPLTSPAAQLVECTATLVLALHDDDPKAVAQAIRDLLPLFEDLTSSRVEQAWRAAELLVDAFDAGAEDGEHPGTVEWGDIEAAQELARLAVRASPR